MAKTNDIAISTDVMKPEIVTFRVIGTSPLIQNNPVEFIGKIETQSLGTKKVYNDEDEARLRLYKDADGHLCHPSEAFTRAMVKAVAGRKFGKLFATAAMKGSVFITETMSIIEDAKGNPLTKYDIDRRSVVVGKARVLRCRPIFTQWSIRIAFEVNTAILRPDQVKQSLALAGMVVGVGDFRPEKGGRFGRFTVE